MAAVANIRFTVQEYLTLDQASDRRFEYIDGDIVLMAGASREHQEYLLVSQVTCHIVHYTRQSDSTWTLAETRRSEDTVELASIQCRLPLAEVYAKMEFAS